MAVRILFALFAVPVFLWAVINGSTPLMFLLLVLAMLGIYEFISFLEELNAEFSLLEKLIVYIFGGFIFYSTIYNPYKHTIFLLFLAFHAISISMLKSRFAKKSILKISGGIFSLIYCSCFFALMQNLRELPYGKNIFLFWVITIWITDSGAYFWGKFLGKGKLMPSISPNKTVTGFVGGLFTPVIIFLVFRIYSPEFFYSMPQIFNSVYKISGICIFISLLAQIGDLIESALKRDAGVKDSSGIFPGHGGVLDRFDSMLFTIVPYFLLVTNFI